MATTSTALETTLTGRKSTGLWRDAFGRLAKNRLAIVGLILVSLFALIALIGPFIADTFLHNYKVQNLPLTVPYGGRPVPPFSEDGYILGTDKLGRDLLARIFDGAQISMTVALVVQVVVLIIGIPIGALAGWYGGRLDNYLMRFTDVIYAFPDLLFIIILTVAFRETWFGRALDGLLLVFIAIGITSWITMARLVRGQLLSLKETEFVEAARAIGVPDRRIVTRHLLPNAIGPVIVAITLGIPGAILAEATLAFLGIGAQAPRASWGSLIDDGRDFIRGDPHLVLFPALAVAIALLSFTFLGDGLRDALDPKLKGKQ
jgi:oligopeptide transport system permease protein